MLQNLNDEDSTATPVVSKKQYQCEKCDKVYFARNSLWYHKKKCYSNKIKNSPDTAGANVANDTVIALVKEIAILKEIFLMFLVKNERNDFDSHS